MAVQIASKPVEPTDDVSGWPPVVVWTKFEGYTYASIRTPDGKWYTTQDPGRTGNQRIFPMTWDELLDHIHEKNWHTMELLS